MATNKSSPPHYYQISAAINSTKPVSKSSESLTNIEYQS
ncbi:unnamed protein product, partial [Rotaria magnacalcarata]